MTELIDRVTQIAQTAAEKLHVRSALNPALWLCAITTPTCLLFAFMFRDIPEVRGWLLAGGLSPIAIACLSFIGFAIFRPDKLQSEEYQIRHESLQLIQQKSGRIAISPTSIEAIANPLARQLEHKGGEDA
jgi:uncharacterized protein YfkK (UPF0435 family)